MDIVRSWKDPEYRQALGAAAPDHPAGEAGLTPITDEQLYTVNGASHTQHLATWGCCACLPWYSGWTRCGLICNPSRPCSAEMGCGH